MKKIFAIIFCFCGLLLLFLAVPFSIQAYRIWSNPISSFSEADFMISLNKENRIPDIWFEKLLESNTRVTNSLDNSVTVEYHACMAYQMLR